MTKQYTSTVVDFLRNYLSRSTELNAKKFVQAVDLVGALADSGKLQMISHMRFSESTNPVIHKSLDSYGSSTSDLKRSAEDLVFSLSGFDTDKFTITSFAGTSYRGTLSSYFAKIAVCRSFDTEFPDKAIYYIEGTLDVRDHFPDIYRFAKITPTTVALGASLACSTNAALYYAAKVLGVDVVSEYEIQESESDLVEEYLASTGFFLKELDDIPYIGEYDDSEDLE